MQVWTSAWRISWGEFFGVSPIGMHCCWAGLQEKSWAYWLSNWKKMLEWSFPVLIIEIRIWWLTWRPLLSLTYTLMKISKSSETDPTCFSLDSIITIIIQHSESSIYIYLQSMKLVVRKLWCFMIHSFEKKHVAMTCLQSSARCVVCFSFVGFSSCVAWWTTMGCESSKRRPEKRDHVSFAANMTRFLNSR